jgi:ureidoacrylate peracid hydrolase
MHKIEFPDHVLKRVRTRRDKLHIYDKLSGPSTALVVIDLQNVFMQRGMALEVPFAREIVPNVNRLANAIRGAGGTVAWVQMTFNGIANAWPAYVQRLSPQLRESAIAELQRGTEGHALYPDLDVQPNDVMAEKTRYSAFIQGASDLDRRLRQRGIDTLVVVGTLTNVCCESTARDAMMLNYKTILVSDANATLTDEEHNAALANVLVTFGDVLSTDETIASLAAGSSAVKQAAAG